jgi:hypothetical protein
LLRAASATAVPVASVFWMASPVVAGRWAWTKSAADERSEDAWVTTPGCEAVAVLSSSWCVRLEMVSYIKEEKRERQRA